MMKHWTGLLTCCLFWISACQSPKELPIYGQKGEDSTYVVPPFRLTDQDSQPLTREMMKGKIYLTDFFFTSCPSICPKMKANLLQIHEAMRKNPEVIILSHTIDQKRDSVSRLKDYATKLGVDETRWKFVTAPHDTILQLAKAYLVSAAEDEDAPGGYVHSGNFILIDQQGRIRGYYDGTKVEAVPQILSDIHQLLNAKP